MSMDYPGLTLSRYGEKELDFKRNYRYFNTRFCKESLGRFINVDPIRDGLNWIVYCSNNPVNYVDPTGLDDIANLASAEQEQKKEEVLKQRDQEYIERQQIRTRFDTGTATGFFAP